MVRWCVAICCELTKGVDYSRVLIRRPGGPCYEKLWCDPVSREMSKCFSGGKASLISMGMSWVSFAQLYVDWMLTLKRPGVAKVSGKWYDGSMPRIVAESFSFPTRSKWFRLLYQQWSKDIHVRCATATMRPSSAMLACHVGCTALPVRRGRLSAVEAWLGLKLSGPVLGLGAGLSLPPAW